MKINKSELVLDNKVDTPFSHWVRNQRKSFREKILSQNKIDKLNSIGFEWDIYTSAWNKNFEALLAFKKKYGHTDITQRSAGLGFWAVKQRKNFKKNKLSQERIDKLNSIDFNWSPRSSIWGKNFEKLLIFKKKHGHTNISTTDKKHSQLGFWTARHRSLFKHHQLSQERIDRLNSIRFEWNWNIQKTKD